MSNIIPSIISIENKLNRIEDEINSYKKNIGPVGVSGRSGIFGMKGFDGQQGFQGSIGQQGSQGIIGDSGNQGNQGTQGSFGIQGSQGLSGLSGVVGNQGAFGTVGMDGIQGVQGFFGVPGSIGFSGNSNNISGAQGFQGQQGATGSQGMVPTGFILRRDEYLANIVDYNIPWPIDSSGNPSPLIFVTMAAGGGGSGGSSGNPSSGVSISVLGAAPSGGGGGFVRRLPIYYEANITSIVARVGFGGIGGSGSSTTATAGSNGDNTRMKINYSINNSGLDIICVGGGGGGPRIFNQAILMAGYGGGVVLDNTVVGGNSQRIICQNANGEVFNLPTFTITTPSETSNITGNYESGSGGYCARIPPFIFPDDQAVSPGSPSIIYSRRYEPDLGNTVTASGGASGLVNYGFGAHSSEFRFNPQTINILPYNGLSGGNGVLILEYYF